MSDASETASILKTIEDAQQLLDWFFGFPTFVEVFPDFGDAEIISIHLRRKGPSELTLHATRSSSTATATFVLGDWIDAQLSGFSHQNVMGGLTLRRAGEHDIAVWERGVGCVPGLHEIEPQPCFGPNGVIRAT